MYYKHILTYNFSEDDTRASFMELVDGLGYTEAEDQSTYVLPLGEALTLVNATKAIEDWSTQRDVQISKEDFVQLFFLASVRVNDKKETKMASKFMKYNPTTKGLK